MTGKDLWAMFDEECRKQHTIALLFGDYDGAGNLRPEETRGKCPEDLTLWNAIAARLDRNTIEIVVDSLKKQQKGLRHG